MPFNYGYTETLHWQAGLAREIVSLMTQITLYAAPGSCARVTMVALEHIGLDFEYRLVRPMIKETRTPEFLKINPKGKVPVLVIDGEVLTENVAIVWYLNSRFADARLLPSAADSLSAVRQLADLCYCSATLHPIVTRVRNPHFFADSEDAQEQVRRSAVESMHPNFALIDEKIQKGGWWYGPDWSAMDAYIYWVWFRTVGSGFPGEDYPAFADFADRMEKREPVQRMLDRERRAEQQLRSEGLI